MAGRLGILLLLLLVAVGGAVGLLVLVLTAVRGPAPAPSGAARAAVRHGAVVHGVALVALVGGLVGVPVLVAELAGGPAQGRLLGLAPAAAGLAFAAVQAVGEATWPRPTGPVRRATLVRRTTRDVAPRRLRLVTWAWAAVGALALVAGGIAAADGGRSIGRTFPAGSTASGPFPGWYFGVPLLVAVAVVLLAAEAVLRLVAVRPTVAGAEPAWDLALRRLSAHRVLRGAQLVLAWTAAGVLVFGGSALRNVGDAVPGAGPGSGAHLVLGTTALLLGVVAFVGGAVVALVPAAPVPAGSRPVPGDAAVAPGVGPA
jgi:hypothetical protein